MGPGGYRFGDYRRLGAPLSLLVILAGVLLIVLVWGLHQYRSVRAVRCPTAADKPPMACRPMIWKTA